MTSDTPAKSGTMPGTMSDTPPGTKADEIRLGLSDGHDNPSGEGHQHGHATASYAALALGALGVVYGDIGTSPLYALRETINAAMGLGLGSHGATASTLTSVPRDIVIGVLSLILWSLVIVVTLKYVFLLLRADNNGEGGTLTLVALAQRAVGQTIGRGKKSAILFLGMAGAALFYGDAVITPAISVLSAVEGLKLVTPAFEPYVVMIASTILIGLFAVQSRGTEKVAAFFGPVMFLWFSLLAVLGIYHIADDWGVFASVNPLFGLQFFYNHPGVSLAVLGTVCLAVTGAEALYADMGHFGRGPISSAWLYMVFPSLWLNYLGQGALILSDPSAIDNPFYKLAPDWFLLPLVIIATVATIIASQAVITGAFSLTRQAVQLGLLPRLEVRHTSAQTSGQIYLPRINWLLLIVVLLLVFAFRSSSALANAYGISVFGAMMVDSILAFIVIWKGWRWSLVTTTLVVVPFLVIDVAFFSANMIKLLHGGFVPVLLALVLILMMWSWVRGSAILFEKTRKADVPLVELIAMLAKSPPHKVKGTAVFLTSDPDTAPAALLHNLKHNKVLHEKNVMLTVRSADTPRVPEEQRLKLSCIAGDFWKVEMQYGYMESPNVPKGLAILRRQGFKFDIMSTSFFLSRRSIKPSPNSGMPIWQDKLFIGLAKSATDATSFFQIPTGRVVEVGTQVTV
jgi:KUP system potassium uptake protein